MIARSKPRTSMWVGRRIFLGGALAIPVAAKGQPRPSQPLRVIIPGTAGGLIDVAARAVGPVMQRELGQTWLIDPRPGANGATGAQAFLALPPDDTALFLTVTSHVVLPFLMNLPFDVIADFQPVAMIGNSTSLMCVPPTSPADTVAEFVAYARANQGKLNYLNGGNGTGMHLLLELLKIKFSLEITSVSYKGLPPGLVDLLNSRLDIGIVSTALAISHVKAGRLKAIAIVGPRRLAELPDIATMAEQNVDDVEFRTLLPLYGRKNMPAAMVESANAAMTVALEDPPTRARLDGAYIQPLPMSPAEVGETMQREHGRLGKLVRQLGIETDGAR